MDLDRLAEGQRQSSKEQQESSKEAVADDLSRHKSSSTDKANLDENSFTFFANRSNYDAASAKAKAQPLGSLFGSPASGLTPTTAK